MKKIKESDLDNPAMRRLLGKQSLFHFALIYFPQLFKFAVPDFHKKWYKLLRFYDLDKQKNKSFFTYLVMVAFRDSAKTSLAKIKLVWDICYARKKLISYICYEKEKAGEALFDVATWLQTNQLIIADFGNLFKEATPDKDKPQKKTIGNFVTSNDIRVTAFSIRQSLRGRNFNFERPDCCVIDDFENNTTKRSSTITKNVIEFLKELIGGLSSGAEVIFLCNKISDNGSVQWLLDTAHDNPDFRVTEVAAIEDGKSTWPARFPLTDKEASEINKTKDDPSAFAVSLESKRRTMNADGSKTFEQEMLNQPVTEGERFFDVVKIDKRIEVLKKIEWQSKDPSLPNYKIKDGNWLRFGKASIDNMNVVAADISEGYGIDSSVIQVFDITNGKQIAEYESSSVSPELVGQLMVEEGKKSGYSLLIPERNSIGVGTVQAIKNTGYFNLYREKTIDKITNKPVFKFGWHTNSKTKPIMLFEFKRDFEAGLIEINSISLLREMRAFTNSGVNYVNFDPEASNHFDRLIAACIAWQGRNIKQIKGYTS
jgi:hypothetical protein